MKLSEFLTKLRKLKREFGGELDVIMMFEGDGVFITDFFPEVDIYDIPATPGAEFVEGEPVVAVVAITTHKCTPPEDEKEKPALQLIKGEKK